MSSEFKLNDSHTRFIFDNEDNLNIFNLLRIIRDRIEVSEIYFEISNLTEKHQSLVLSKFPSFLKVYDAIVVDNNKATASVRYSKVSESFIKKLCEKNEVIVDNDVLIFDVKSCSKEENIQDPHLVKNVRGAVLLSLVQDLLKLGSIKKSFSLFDEKSPILLHSASTFLFNKENAKMVWDILARWEKDNSDNIEINLRIHKSSIAQKHLNILSEKVSNNSTNDVGFKSLLESLPEIYNLKNSVYSTEREIKVWFIDDHHSNGWLKLITNLIPEKLFNIEAFGSTEDVNKQLSFLSKIYPPSFIPDLAFVDLRLDSSDVGIDEYNAKDLTGFKVVDMLFKQWSGLSIMIVSASNKLWNMDNAIQKGAVAYWRKSDEVSTDSPKSSIFTAFDIHIQFIDKFSTTLKKVEYRYAFKLVERILSEVKELNESYASLKFVVENYFYDLVQKTSWMCWRKEDATKVNDSLFLGVTEIFNEIENCLWTPNTGKLVLTPQKSVQNTNDRLDKKVINDSLDYIDKKYDIRGKALQGYYEANKAIRNKLPIIHGSKGGQGVKHAELINIESSLLIIACLVIELKCKQ